VRVVCDTGVWIDLKAAGLLPKALKAPLEMAVPDILFDELEDPSGEELVRRGMRVMEIDRGGMRRLQELAQCPVRPGIADLSALILAESLGAVLATRDGALAALARRRGVKVFGTADLLAWMEGGGLLKQGEANRAAQRLRAAGRNV